jgi:hypothetical protein
MDFLVSLLEEKKRIERRIHLTSWKVSGHVIDTREKRLKGLDKRWTTILQYASRSPSFSSSGIFRSVLRTLLGSTEYACCNNPCVPGTLHQALIIKR